MDARENSLPMDTEQFMPADTDETVIIKSPIKDKREYIDRFLPVGYSVAVVILALLSLLLSIILAPMTIGGYISYKPYLLLPQVLLSAALAFWVIEKKSVLSSVMMLFYHVSFTVISIWLLDTVFFYPVVPSVIVVILCALISKQWKYYQIIPTPVTAATDMEIKRIGVKHWIIRCVLLVLTAMLIVTSVLPSFVYINVRENEADFTEGEFLGRKYINEFMNLTFSSPGTWWFARGSDLQAVEKTLYGDGYDPEIYMLLMYAEAPVEIPFTSVEIHAIRQSFDVKSDEFITHMAGQNQVNAAKYEKIVNERLEPMIICGRKYEVLHTDFVAKKGENNYHSFEEYLFVRCVGELTLSINIYMWPDSEYTIEELLALFEPVES